jgi:hypothetical protein
VRRELAEARRARGNTIAAPPAVKALKSNSRPHVPLGQSPSVVQSVAGASTQDVWQVPPLQSTSVAQRAPATSPPTQVP